MSIRKLTLNIDYKSLKDFVLYEIIPKFFDHPKTMYYQLAVQCKDGAVGKNALYESCGSLIYDWDAYDPERHTEVPRKKNIFKEEQFFLTPNIFLDTIISEVNNNLKKNYNLFRGRLILIPPKSCLTFHTDETPRLHIPLITSPNAFMVIEDQVHRLNYGSGYVVDTRIKHTAVNAGLDYRVHLVYVISNNSVL